MLRQETQTRLYGKPLVKPTQVETELERIRSAAAVQDAAREEEVTGSASTRARATLSNLIILNASASSERVDDSIDKLIDELCVAYPSRFFIVDANLNQDVSDTGIATAVSSRCFLTDSGAHVCSEEVYVSVEKKAVPLVKNMLVSLFAPDVDVVLLVIGDLLRADPEQSFETLLAALGPMCERVVYDSGMFQQYDKSLLLLMHDSESKAGAGSAATKPGFEVYDKLSDVNWKRTRRWRALISEGFDAERLADTSVLISRVRLFCRCSEEDLKKGLLPADALLFAGWICSSLGKGEMKKVASANGLVFESQGAQKGLKIEFVAEPSSAWALTDAKLAAIEVQAETPDAQALLKIERMLDRGSAEISLGFTDTSPSGKGSREFSTRNAPFASPPLSELVLSHIVSRKDDQHYLRALDLSLTLCRAASK